MAKIPTFNPLSGEARSPLIAGLTEVANKISDALNMQSEEFENIPLSEVFIADGDRYRIYEVDMGKRLWLSDPSPIIRKNGSIINSAVDNFTVDLIGGSVAFEPTNRLLATDNLTATFTSVKAESQKLYDIQQTLIDIQTKLAKDKGYYESPTELRVAYPTATNGDFAVVGTTDTMWVWDSDTLDWKDTHKITDLTNYYDKSAIDNFLTQKEPTLNAKGIDTADDNFYYGGRKQWIDLFVKVRNTLLTGIDLTAQGKVEEIDNVIIALGKLQSQINSNNTNIDDLSTGKVDKIDGKGLSTNDLTDELKTKYDKSGKRLSRFTIGVSTASWTSDDCDYLCDGTNDQLEINQAIQALPSSGGEIVVLDGTYNITSKIDINKSNVSIRGNGNATILKRMWDSTLREGTFSITNSQNCKIKNLQLNGNKWNYTSENNCSVFVKSGSLNTIDSVQIVLSGKGIFFESSTKNKVSNSILKYNGIQAFSSDKNIFVNNILDDCFYGIYLQSSNDCLIANNIGNICYNGIFLNTCNNTGVFDNNMKDNEAIGISLNNSSGNNLDGNVCLNGQGTVSDYTSSQYTIKLNGTANNNNLISSNLCLGKDVVIDGGISNTSVNNKFE